MELREYFEETPGFGVLSTADGEGRVNSAVFARPHCFDDGTIGFIMGDRLTHQNLQANVHAVYLFRESPEGGVSSYGGKRLYLRKVGEDDDQERIGKLRRRYYAEDREGSFLVTFAIEKVLPLVGAG